MNDEKKKQRKPSDSYSVASYAAGSGDYKSCKKYKIGIPFNHDRWYV